MSEIEPSSMPREILKQPIAVWMYFIAVGALAAVVVGIPIVSIWATFEPVVWNGWTLCISGLTMLVGVQSAKQGVS